MLGNAEMLKWPWNYKSHGCKALRHNTNFTQIEMASIRIKFPPLHFELVALSRLKYECRTRSNRYFKWMKKLRSLQISIAWCSSILYCRTKPCYEPYWELWIKCKAKHKFNCFCARISLSFEPNYFACSFSTEFVCTNNKRFDETFRFLQLKLTGFLCNIIQNCAR